MGVMSEVWEERRKLRALGAFTLALTCVWLTIAVNAVHMALPFNPIRLPFERWVHVRFWAPEGWGFFTRNPQEEVLLVFVRERDGQWTSASMGPNGMPRNAFGLNRASRAQNVELGQLAGGIPQKAYQPCQHQPAVCLEQDPVVVSLNNPTPSPTLCGQVGIAMQKPVPWAWSDSRDRIVMPSRVARMKVDCHD
jgi:antimicrobial peptide system SdpA family protein